MPANASVTAPATVGSVKSAAPEPVERSKRIAKRRDLSVGSQHQMFAGGRIAAPMPRLASDAKLTLNGKGPAKLNFKVRYAVSNTQNRKHVRADRAVIEVSVGPVTGASVYRHKMIDKKLNQRIITHSYSVKLPAKQVSFLNANGLKSKNRATRKKALEGVKVEVHQERDFKNVNGAYDWKQGLGFNAATRTLHAAGDEPAEFITVTNSTGNGVFNYGSTPNPVPMEGDYTDTFSGINVPTQDTTGPPPIPSAVRPPLPPSRAASPPRFSRKDREYP